MLIGVGLVLASSLAHAVWNLLVKRSRASGVAFVWLYSAMATPVLLIALLVAGAAGRASTAHWWAAVLSAGLHTIYAVVLQRSYASADLGVVYPVARAGAPVLVALVSIIALGRASSPTLWAAIAVIAAGVVLLAADATTPRRAWARAVRGGAVTALAIAAYTSWDAYAIAALHVDVLSYLATATLAQFLVLTAAVAPQRARVIAVARSSWRLAAPVAALVPTSYALVLLAFHHLDAPTVAALRSSSILIAAVLGWWLLDEPRTPRRAAGAAVLTIGVITSAISA